MPPADPALTSVRRWEPVQAPFTCGSLCRSRDHYLQVLAQFSVTDNPRYQPDPNGIYTYCNIYACDVMQAFGVILPHVWFGPAANRITEAQWRELNANAMIDWLNRRGTELGWKKCRDGLDAAENAAHGFPTLATWKNPDLREPGHLAVVMPSHNHTIAITQAGSHCLYDAPVSAGFDGLPVVYWEHT